jgi:apolipoprotein N-acyltransferase
MSTTFAASESAAPEKLSLTSVSRQRSIDDIITAARQRPAPVKGALWPASLASVLMWLSFTPADFGPLAWVALVPLMQLALLPRLSKRTYGALYVAGALFWFPTLQWMRLGDQAMYLAWFALAAYLAFYFPLFVGLTRTAVRRFHAPLWIAAPVVWVGLEFLRAHLMTGFAWYFLGHTQYRWASIVQLSDVFGAYGVSYVVATANAALALLLPTTWLEKAGLVHPEDRERFHAAPTGLRRPKIAVIAALAIVATTWIYGAVRLGQSNFTAGPRIGLIQGNFTTSLKHDDNFKDEIYSQHRALTGETIPHQPDVIVWPETMFPMPMFQTAADVEDVDLETIAPHVPSKMWKSDLSQKTVERMSQEVDAALIIGVDTLIARRDGYDHFNSAAFATPDKGLGDRYDKIHRVPFGEYIPLRDTIPFLHKLTPFGDTFGIAAGTHVHVFQYKDWKMMPLICFEDTVPHLVRSMAATAAAEKGPVDILVNLTNDGWFHGSSELDQHLITAQFRCIENRMPMVRAVNTGISAFIDGNGAVREPEVIRDLDALMKTDRPVRTTIRDPQTGQYYKQWNAAFVSTVPLDPRTSLYQRFGDWFATLCTAACLILCIAGFWRPAPKLTTATI